MKKIVIIFLLTFTKMISAADEDIKLTFNQNNAKYWQYISDRTMGGVSTGEASLENDNELYFARLAGNVSTRNNGGFIQLRSNFSFENFQNDLKKIKGVRLNVRGNSETYHIFIRIEGSKSYRDFYLAPFIAKTNWELIDLPFDIFKHRISNKSDLEGKNLQTFGIVAYGRDFISDVSLSEIIFYY